MSGAADERVTLARIVRTQGRRGEVLADLFTDFPDLFTESKNLLLVAPDSSERPVDIENFWKPTGRSAGRVVLKIAGIDSISDAEKFAGHAVQLPKVERLGLEDGNYYVSDLVGCSVVDGEQTLGTVDDVHFPHTSDGRRIDDAAPLFVIRRTDGDELLVPFVNAYVERIDIAAKQIVLRLPAGMLDING